MRGGSRSSLGPRLVHCRNCRSLKSRLLGKNDSKYCPKGRKILIVEDVPRKIPCIF
jgi:hypothetical protein